MSSTTPSTAENVKEESIEHICGIVANSLPDNVMDNSEDSSYCLHTSLCSITSNDSDLSPLSLSLDKEMDTNDIDELPAFEIRLISPLGRTPSPIDSEDMTTPNRPMELLPNPFCNNPDFVALHDINAQISPPTDNGEQGDEDGSSLSRTNSLETIFEGVFLNTPPRQHRNLKNNRHIHNRGSLLEKVTINRLHTGKENQSPLPKPETSPRRNFLDFGCITNAFNGTENGFS